MSVTLNLLSTVVGGITTGLRKLGSMGKRDLKNTMKAFFKKKPWPWQKFFIFSYFFLSKYKNLTNDVQNLTNDVISTLMSGGNHRWVSKLETGVLAWSNEQNKEKSLLNAIYIINSFTATIEEHYVQSDSKHNSI